MIRNLLVAVALAATTGCAFSADGIWFVDLPTLDLECDTTFVENIIESDPPIDEGTLDWVISDEATMSNSAF